MPTRRPTPRFFPFLVLFTGLLLQAPSRGAEPIDLDALNRIRDEGLHRSRVMDHLSYLTDVIGPRLTGSPAMRRANEWVLDAMRGFGMENAHLEEWGPFGRGWSFERCSVHVVRPRAFPVPAVPRAWTPGTEGPVRGEALRLSLRNESDMKKWEGKLRGKILLFDEAPEIEPADDALFTRYDQDELSRLEDFPVSAPRRRGPRGDFRARYRQRQEFFGKLRSWLVEQGAVASLAPSSRNDGVLRVSGGGSREPDENPGIPSLVIGRENYAWICRMLDRKETVEIEVDVAARFHDDDLMAYNSIAEIPGRDLADQVVMLGAHLDSWHAGTGATDNASGCAVVMEAARILTTLPERPRRTIRVALWSGEEQGLLGSRAYVRRHFAERERTPKDEEGGLPPEQEGTGPLRFKPEWEKLCSYFNLDNGSGRIRGIWCEENVAVVPIFRAWIEPLRDLGVTTVTLRRTGGTDHQSFDRVGLPGFQFVQDRLDYFTRTHHTNLDVADRVVPEDLVQAATVMAAFAWFAANRDEPLPRRPLPPEERESD